MRDAELLALLAEVRAHSGVRESSWCICEFCSDLLVRIDAALAERDAEKPVEGEALFTREWHEVNSPNRVEALLKDGTRVSARKADINGTLGWLWDAEIRPTGFELTLDAAKAAAVRAARGVR